MMCVLDWWCSEWWHHNLYEYMKMDWSNECVVIDEWWFQYEVCLFEFLFVWEWIEMIVIDCTPIPYSSTQTIHNISFYIESLWFEYELCVVCYYLSSIYLVFFIIQSPTSSIHSINISYSPNTLNCLHSLWRMILWWMRTRETCVESEWYVRSLLINLMWRMRLSDELFRLLKCMKHCETIWKRYCL